MMEADLSEREALIERLEKLTEPDREVDADLDVALFGGETVWITANYTMEVYPATRRPSTNHVGGFVNGPVPPVTASLDAAVAMVERMLPGWDGLVPINATGEAWLWPSGGMSRGHRSRAATPAIALLVTLLRALAQPSHS